MSRATILDLATAAGVSVATVNRVISGNGGVRPQTIQRVRDAAVSIGFYGLGTLESRVAASRRTCRLGFVLQQPNRRFYQMVGAALRDSCAAVSTAKIESCIEFLRDLTPANVAGQMLAVGRQCDAVAVIAAVHPLVTEAIIALQGEGKPVFGLVSQLAATGTVHYVGLDNWKLGRTAGWMFHRACPKPGKLGVLIGNHRYRCQEMNEAGLRSYIREHAPEFAVLEPVLTYESSAIADEATERLLSSHPDLAGVYIAGGGVSGALAALRRSGAGGRLIAIGHELMENTRAALNDSTLTMVMSHPLTIMCERLVHAMIDAVEARGGGTITSVLPFDIHFRESL